MFAHTSTSPRDSSGRRSTSTSYNYVRSEVIDGSPLEELFETTTDRNGAFTLLASGPDTWLKLRVTGRGGAAMHVRAAEGAGERFQT